MINWMSLKGNMLNYLNSKESDNYTSIANNLSLFYHEEMIKGATDTFGNKLIQANYNILKKSFIRLFKCLNNNKLKINNQIVNIYIKEGIINYWNTAVLSFDKFLIVGANEGISNIINRNAITFNINWPECNNDSSILVNALLVYYKKHLNNINGIFSVLNQSGTVIQVPWSGIN